MSTISKTKSIKLSKNIVYSTCSKGNLKTGHDELDTRNTSEKQETSEKTRDDILTRYVEQNQHQ